MILRASRAFRYVDNDLQIQLLGYKNQMFYHKRNFLFMAVSHLFFRLIQRMYSCNIVCLNILAIKLNFDIDMFIVRNK